MIYDLTVQGYSDFSRYGTVIERQKIALDPLSGVLDGSNRYFSTSFFPILTSGSLLVYTSGSLASGVADFDTGQVTLNTAPIVQPKATYTFVPYNSTQMMMFLMSGFDEMETRWERGWKLLDGYGQIATENSVSIFVTDSTGSDPACGPSSFSQSRVQVAFYMACVEYRYRLTQFGSSANTDYAYRSSGGVSVDKSRRPGNLDMVVKMLESRVVRALRMAQEQQITDGSQWGSYIGGIHSEDYLTNFGWQYDSAYSGLGYLAYNVPVRTF